MDFDFKALSSPKSTLLSSPSQTEQMQNLKAKFCSRSFSDFSGVSLPQAIQGCSIAGNLRVSAL